MANGYVFRSEYLSETHGLRLLHFGFQVTEKRWHEVLPSLMPEHSGPSLVQEENEFLWSSNLGGHVAPAAQAGSIRGFCRVLMVSHCRWEPSTSRSWAGTIYPACLPLARLKAPLFISVLARWPSRSNRVRRRRQDARLWFDLLGCSFFLELFC